VRGRGRAGCCRQRAQRRIGYYPSEGRWFS
jgi:hypothetical protein